MDGRTCVVGDEEADVGIVQDSGDADQPGTSTGDNGDVLPGVLTRLVLAVHVVVQAGHGLSQGLDTGGWAILAAVDADVDGLGPREAALDIVLDLYQEAIASIIATKSVVCGRGGPPVTYLRGTLTQICPLLGLFKETIFTSTLAAPDYTGRSTARIESGMR